MSETSVVTLIVAVISALGAVGASVAGIAIQRNQRDIQRSQRLFRKENTEQHGATMALIKEIQITTRETKQDVRELRSDFDDHQKQAHPLTKPRAVRSTVNGAEKITKPKAKRPSRRSA